MRRRIRLAALAAHLALISGQAAAAQAHDPVNPTCPSNPDWSTYPRMRFTERQENGRLVLLAEGTIDETTPARLQSVLKTFRGDDIWLRSPGGDARAAEQAGMLIRDAGRTTRIPASWAGSAACTLMFLGGITRSMEPGGLLIVSMFTRTTEAELRQRAASGADPDDLLTDVARAAALRATEDNDFMIRMGVSRRFLADIVYRQHAIATAADRSTRRCLTLDEAWRYNVVNFGPGAPH